MPGSSNKPVAYQHRKDPYPELAALPGRCANLQGGDTIRPGLKNNRPSLEVRQFGPSATRARLRPQLAAVGVIVWGLALCLPGINWGLPATTSWSQDTIAGIRTLGAVEGWPVDWKGRYPPLHYLILRAVYEPALIHWETTGAMTRDPESGQVRFVPPFDEKIGLLILLARVVSVVSAIGAALGLWMCARVITSDEAASVTAAAAFMTGAVFVYFAHLGNVDAPSLFWFCWSAYFYGRLLKTHRWTDALWLGLFGSLAITTKDAVAGMYPGMAVVLWLSEARSRPSGQSRSRALLHGLLQGKWLIGIIAFALPYLLTNGVFANPQAYVERMKYWLDITPDTIHARQYRYPNQLILAWAAVRYAAGAVGWPMLAAMTAAVVYGLRRHRRTSFVVLVPALGYYLIVIARMDFVYSRFLLPPMALIFVLTGLALADWVRRPTWPLGWRALLISIVFMPSIGYAVAINGEMMTDSRYRAEVWFRENVPISSSIGAFSKPQYLPRLTEMGYMTYAVEMTRASFERPQPEYLVLTSYNYEDFDADQHACMNDLVGGRLGYKLTGTFKSRYLGTRSHWLSLAGWYAPTPGKISPTIIILNRSDSGILQSSDQTSSR